MVLVLDFFNPFENYLGIQYKVKFYVYFSKLSVFLATFIV